MVKLVFLYIFTTSCLFLDGLKTINLATAKKLKTKSISVTPGCKVCPSCNIKIFTDKNTTEPSEEDEPMQTNENCEKLETDIAINSGRCSLNSTLLELEVSPFKTHAVASHSLITHGKKKLQQCMEKLSEKQKYIQEKVATVLDIDSSHFDISTDHALTEESNKIKANDLDRLMNLIKEKMETSNRPEIIKLLTLVPLSW
jgi:hypothetical protein